MKRLALALFLLPVIFYGQITTSPPGGGGGGSGTVTHTAGSLTAGNIAIGNGSADLTVAAAVPVNLPFREVYNVKAYGATGNGSTDDSTAIQSALDACYAAGGGTVYFPSGTYKIATGLIVGAKVNSDPQSYVSLVGDSTQGVLINYAGSTSGTAITLQRDKYSNIKNIGINNTVSKGTTVGLLTTGPPSATGTQSNGNVLEQVAISGFHYGWSSSNGTSTSSEITAVHMTFTSCDYGFFNNDFNALNMTFFQLEISSCGYGIYAGTSGIHVFGGAGSANTTASFYFTNGGNNSVYDFRDESSVLFIRNDATNVTVYDCDTQSGVVNNGGVMDVRNSTIRGDFQVDNGSQNQFSGTTILSTAAIKGFSNRGENSRYSFDGCYRENVDTSLVTIPNRKGVFNNNTFYDSVSYDFTPIDANTAPTLKAGFFATTPVAQQTGNAVTALSNYGLVQSATWPDASVSFTDVTTGNSSTSNHGFLKKLDNVSTHYMDGTGNWSTPAGGVGGSPGSPAGSIQYNSAGSFAGVSGVGSDGTGFTDSNGNKMLAFSATASAVDGFTMTNGSTANPATIILSATGTDSNINIELAPKGTGNVLPTSDGSVQLGNSGTRWKFVNIYDGLGFDGDGGPRSFESAASSSLNLGHNGGLYINVSVGGGVATQGGYGFQSSYSRSGANIDTQLSRNASGVVEVNNGTPGTFRDIKLRALQSSGVTFANLPTASSGYEAYITDGLAANCGDTTCTTWGTTVTSGGGALKLLIWYNGVNWTLVGK